MTLLPFALDAVHRGLKVHPLKPRTKEPATPHGALDATLDVDQVRRWWSTDPRYNIGCSAGVVLDIDEGLSSVQELRNFLMLNGIAPSLAVRTGGRPGFRVQLHYSGAGPRFHYEANHCRGEVRGTGWYGLWCGSIHPDSGATYELLLDLPIQPWKEEYLQEERIGGGGRPTVGGAEYAATDAWSAREVFDRLLGRARSATKGSRNRLAHAVTWFAARAWLAGVFEEERMFDGYIILDGFSEAEIKQKIWDAVNPLYKHDRRDVRKMLAASWAYGLSKGRLALQLYPEDFAMLRTLSDFEPFQKAWDGDTSEFQSPTQAKEYMEELLTNAGCTEVTRVLRASKIFEAIGDQISAELEIAEIMESGE